MIKRICQFAKARLFAQLGPQATKVRLGTVKTPSGKDVNVSRITANGTQDSFLLSSPVGGGGFSKVRAARKDGREYVAKVMYLEKEALPKKVGDNQVRIDVTKPKKVARERALMNRAGSPLAFSHVFVREGKAYCFIEKNMGGDMLKLAQRSPQSKELQAKIALHLIAQISRDLKNAHAKDIYHSDVKLENFLWNSSEILLADFGSSIDTRSEPMTFGGTPIYGSPEKMLDGQPTLRSDVWSLGIAALNFLYGNNHPLSLPNDPEKLRLRLASYRVWRDFGVEQGTRWEHFSRRIENDFGEAGRFILDSLLAPHPQARASAAAAQARAAELLEKSGGRADVDRYFAARASEAGTSALSEAQQALQIFEQQ